MSFLSFLERPVEDSTSVLLALAMGAAVPVVVASAMGRKWPCCCRGWWNRSRCHWPYFNIIFFLSKSFFLHSSCFCASSKVSCCKPSLSFGSWSYLLLIIVVHQGIEWVKVVSAQLFILQEFSASVCKLIGCLFLFLSPGSNLLPQASDTLRHSCLQAGWHWPFLRHHPKDMTKHMLALVRKQLVWRPEVSFRMSCGLLHLHSDLPDGGQFNCGKAFQWHNEHIVHLSWCHPFNLMVKLFVFGALHSHFLWIGSNDGLELRLRQKAKILEDSVPKRKLIVHIGTRFERGIHGTNLLIILQSCVEVMNQTLILGLTTGECFFCLINGKFRPNSAQDVTAFETTIADGVASLVVVCPLYVLSGGNVQKALGPKMSSENVWIAKTG